MDNLVVLGAATTKMVGVRALVLVNYKKERGVEFGGCNTKKLLEFLCIGTQLETDALKIIGKIIIIHNHVIIPVQENSPHPGNVRVNYCLQVLSTNCVKNVYRLLKDLIAVW